MKVFITTLLCIVIAQLGAWAQTVPVFVSHTGDDNIGKQLAAELRNEVRSSPSFELVFVQSSSWYVVSIVTLDPDDNSYSDQNQTIYSIVFQIYNNEGFNYFIQSFVGVCGKSRVAPCAEDIVRDLSVANDEFLSAVANELSGVSD